MVCFELLTAICCGAQSGSSASGAIAPSADPSTSESDSGLGAADGQLACCRHPLPLRLSWRSLVRRCGAVGGGLG